MNTTSGKLPLRPVLPAFVFAVAGIIIALIFSSTYHNRNRPNDLISVTGLGKKNFEADLIVWSGSFSRRLPALKDAYAALEEDRTTLRTYLTEKGVREAEIVFSAVDIDKEFDTWYDDDGNRRSNFLGYRLGQTVSIESREVDKVERISREVTELINKGVELNSNRPNYYYTKLAELKIEMIAAATKDARIRAEQIAENSDADLGDLRFARMGVFQIIAQNSSEDYSWGGAYNTTSRRKTATITMKLQFGVD